MLLPDGHDYHRLNQWKHVFYIFRPSGSQLFNKERCKNTATYKLPVGCNGATLAHASACVSLAVTFSPVCVHERLSDATAPDEGLSARLFEDDVVLTDVNCATES